MIEVDSLPERVIDKWDRKRRDDRRQFWKDTASIIGGAALIVGAIASLLTLLIHKGP